MKPMLAYTIEDTSKESYPCLLSVKLDGIRAIVVDGVVMSRSMKPIRSKVVQSLFGKPEFNGLDGELLYGEWSAPNVFNVTTSAVMATELKPEFDPEKIAFVVFDYYLSEQAYEVREELVHDIIYHSDNLQVYSLASELAYSEQDLLAFEAKSLEDGYEGIMKRSPTGKYKQGRSTFKEQGIGKLKRFSDDEAIVIGFEEKLHNTNEAKTNELGRTQRSQAQEGMVGAGTLGALVCMCNGIRFTMGSGFDDAGRAEVWDNQDKYLGKLAKFKHFEIGAKDSFRFPIFQGWRDADDMSEG
jgi:DNA ligase-1